MKPSLMTRWCHSHPLRLLCAGLHGGKVLVSWFLPQAQDRERSRVEVVWGSTPQHCALFLAMLRCSRIQDHLPADTLFVRWQSEG
jgi:hypothetical protein